jgi:hypothetical protein
MLERQKMQFGVQKEKGGQGPESIIARKLHFYILFLFQSSAAQHAKVAQLLLVIFSLPILSPLTLVLVAFLSISTFAPLIAFPFLVISNACAPLPQFFYCGRFWLASLSLALALRLFVSRARAVV